jgi:oligopeptidase B
MSRHRHSLDIGLGSIALAAALVFPLPSAAAPPPGTVSKPPVAAIHPKTIESPAGSRVDDYYWLRDDQRKSPDMLAYLNAENAYTDSVMAHTKAEQDSLYEELSARIKPDDATVPARKNGWWYYVRYVPGKDYPVYARRKGSPDAPEQVMLDGNAMAAAAGTGYFQIGSPEVTSDGRIVAYGLDTVGRRQYRLKFKNLDTGEDIRDEVENVEPNFAWANDGKTVLYVEKDPVTLLSVRVKKHVLGTEPKSDPVVYEEKDHAFYLGVDKSRSDRFLWIELQSTVSTEQWYADANDPKLAFKVVVPRERDHEYQAEDLGSDFILRTNWKAKNFRIVRASMATVADRGTWKDEVPARDDAFVHGFETFKDYLVVAERANALRRIMVKRWADGRQSIIAADEPSYVILTGENPETDTGTLRYVYSSLTTPRSVYDVDMSSGEKKLMKRDPVGEGFDPENYRTEFVWAPSRDGKKIPVSILYRKGFTKGRDAGPLLQYGYGSYGLSTDPSFNANVLSLVDRGFVYAIANVRGGQELGRAWYEDGKLENKKNTFNDFVDVTKFLVQQGYAASDKVYAYGGSAGGLLMGAIANQCPECYRGVIAAVPFVDVVTTMLDESIPLTSNEFDEWGNPKEKKYYDYMLSYSPYDNVAKKAYPAMLVTTGLWDSQVQYFEPAKWVAKLRAMKTDSHTLLLHINMEAGHGGNSGRFRRLKETALQYAFMLDQLETNQGTGTGTK